MFGTARKLEKTAATPAGKPELPVVESGRGGGGERFVLNGRIGPYWIAGLHVRIPQMPGLGEPVTLKLHGVGQFLGRVNRISGERIRLTFDGRGNDAVELLRAPA